MVVMVGLAAVHHIVDMTIQRSQREVPRGHFADPGQPWNLQVRLFGDADGMLKQGSAVIIFLTGSRAQPHTPASAPIGAAFGAIENLTRHMAIDLSPGGVRVVCVRTSANPDSRTIQDLTNGMAKMMNITSEQANANLAQSTLLKVSPRTMDTAFAAALVASDLVRMMTGTVLNVSAGVVPD